MSGYLVTAPLFTPNVVETPSAEHIEALERAAQQGGAGEPQYYELPRGSRGVRLRINAIQVMDGLSGSGSGVYVVASVTDGLGEQPITFQGKVYERVRNGELLPLGRPGDPTAVFNVYLREGKMPRLLSFSLLVLRSNQGLRQMGLVISKTLQDERFRKLSEIVGGAAAAANPAYGVVWQGADEAMGLVGEYLAAKPDDQLAYYQVNYTNLFDDLGAGKHPPDQPTMQVDRIRFAYEIDVA